MCDIAIKYRSKCDGVEYFKSIEGYDSVNSEWPSITDLIANVCPGDIITITTQTQGQPDSINEESAEVIAWSTECSGPILPCLTVNADNTGAVVIGDTSGPVAFNSYAGPYFEVEFCESEDDALYFTDTALEFYLGKVIQFNLTGLEGKFCGTVSRQDCNNEQPIQDLSVLSIIDYYLDCETCEYIPPVIPEETKVKQRSVKPGYDTPGCPPEYYDKTSCKFGEAQFQEVANKRYGIEFCCDPDQQKWEIKKELLDLAAAKDPDICETICPTPEEECSTKCLNIVDCFTADQFGLFLSMGDLQLSPITDYINSYQTSNPTAYAQMMESYDCIIETDYCVLGICYYTLSCYEQMLEGLTGIDNDLNVCRAQADYNEQTQIDQYQQTIQDIQACIKAQQNVQEEIDELNAMIGELQAQLAVATDPVEIAELEQDIATAQANLTQAQAQLAALIENCGGNVTQLQQQIIDITLTRQIVNAGYQYMRQWLDNLIELLSKLRDRVQGTIQGSYNFTCCDLYPIICGNSTITFTGCSGNELTVPLGAINRKVYYKEGTTITFNNPDYATAIIAIVESTTAPLTFNEFANQIFTWGDECISSSCSDDPNPPYDPGANAA